MNRTFASAFRITSAIAALCNVVLYGFLTGRTVFCFFYDTIALIDGGYKVVPKENVNTDGIFRMIAPYAAAWILLVVLAVFAVLTLAKTKKTWPAVLMLVFVLLSCVSMFLINTVVSEYMTLRNWFTPLFYLFKPTDSTAFLCLKFYPAVSSVLFLLPTFFVRKAKN